MSVLPAVGVAPNQTPTAITARLDRLASLTPRHKSLVVLLVSLFVFDIIDLSSFGVVAPGLIADWGVTVEQLGVLTSTAFAGMFVGGLVGGRLADHFGRRPLVIAGVMFFSLASIASAFAPTPEVLGAIRFLTGVGLQMATGAILVTVSETFPKAVRGRVMALVLGLSLIGAPAIALVARIFVPMGMWPVVFVVGGLGIIPALFAMKFLPESPRWLAARGRGEEADAQLKLYEAQYLNKHGSLPQMAVEAPAIVVPTRAGMLDLFKRSLLARTLVATLAFCTLILLNYGFGSWLPTILIERGYGQEDALTFSFILSFGAMAGALLAMLFVDKIERKVAISISVTLMAVCYILIGFVDSVPVLLAAGMLAQLLSQTVSATMYSYVPEMFPVAVRGAGAGFANGTGRVAGIFSGIILTAVLAVAGVSGVFVYLAAIAVAMAIIISFGPKTGVRDAYLKAKQERSSAL